MGRNERLIGAIVAEKYRLVRLIGTGAMGAVYEAHHVDIGKRVAIKLIHTSFIGNADVAARFRREARAIARIESDYIVQCFDVGLDLEHGLYMVIEYLEGEDLEQRLRRVGRLDVATAVTLGHQVARGLAKAHAAGVVHRDLKPANVFLTTRRDDDALLAKVLDFGISKLRDTEHTSPEGITNPGITLGTPQYMSPEQIDGVDVLDGRTDVWSLAAVLYESLRGAPPFVGGDYLAVLMSIVQEDVPPLVAAAPWGPGALADAIHEGLARSRDQRPDAATFAARLHAAVPDVPVRLSGSYVAVRADGPPASEDVQPTESELSARGRVPVTKARAPTWPARRR
jgi:serine/threonine-protein kinase